MKVYSYSQARDRLSAVLDEAKREEVIIRRRNGDQFSIVPRVAKRSPFDVEPVANNVTIDDILEAIQDTRERR